MVTKASMRLGVVIPVGPNRHHQDWLPECIHSIVTQTRKPDVIYIIDDMAGLDRPDIKAMMGTYRDSIPLVIWQSPWRLGVAHAFNFGVALCNSDAVLLMGADDELMPQCLEVCEAEWQQHSHKESAYFYLPVLYIDSGETQDVACGAAMVSRELWQLNGGFPTESASGASDAALISIMYATDGKAGHLVKVGDGTPLYRYRRHPFTDTASKGPWQGVIIETRDLVSREWKQPQWGRY